MENSSWLTEGCSPRLRRDDSEGIGELSQMLLRTGRCPVHRDVWSHGLRASCGQRYLCPSQKVFTR
jgi:hypothetical protein